MKFIENTNRKNLFKFDKRMILIKNTNQYVFDEIIHKLFGVMKSTHFYSNTGISFITGVHSPIEYKTKLIPHNANLINTDIIQYNIIHNNRYEIIDDIYFERNILHLFFYD